MKNEEKPKNEININSYIDLRKKIIQNSNVK